MDGTLLIKRRKGTKEFMSLWDRLKRIFKKRKPNIIVPEMQKAEELEENKPVIVRKQIYVSCPEMTKEEYKKKMEENENWMPGWEAIDEELTQLYEEQKPERLDMTWLSKVSRGSTKQLDGYSFYTSVNGYKHLISYGMSELYAKEEAYGQEKSKWGYEMTMKLAQDQDAMWATNLMANLARYTFANEEALKVEMLISGDGTPLKPHTNSKITALLVVEDEELPPLNTLNGLVIFLQLVGITENESEWLKQNSDKTELFIEQMKVDNPMLVTDLNREQDCSIMKQNNLEEKSASCEMAWADEKLNQ